MSNGTNQNLAEIKKTYQLIDDNFDTVYAKCDPDQKTKLVALRDAARDAFWRAAAENLSDNHNVVAQTIDELQTTNNQIQSDVQSLKNVSSFLDNVTQGVKLAAALVTLAAA
jgi:prefoldin subunit 5